MQRAGKPVPALDGQPQLPVYLQDAYHCFIDTISDGSLSWSDCMTWCATYGASGDAEYIWEVITTAKQEVDKWQKSSKPQSHAPRPEITSPVLKS